LRAAQIDSYDSQSISKRLQQSGGFVYLLQYLWVFLQVGKCCPRHALHGLNDHVEIASKSTLFFLRRCAKAQHRGFEITFL